MPSNITLKDGTPEYLDFLDYFAAMYLSGNYSVATMVPPEEIAKKAYDVAEAMIKEKRKRNA